MRIVATAAVLAASLSACGPANAQEPSLTLTVEFMAASRERPEAQASSLDFWSFYDHIDSVMAVVSYEAEGSPGPIGTVFTEVSVGVARIVWESAAMEVPNYEATAERSYWLPSIVTSQHAVTARGPTRWVAAVVRPDYLLGRLREHDPELLLTAVWIRSCYIGRGGTSDGTANCAENEIPVYMAH